MSCSIAYNSHELNVAEHLRHSALIAFDLDNTLASSRQPMIVPMIRVFERLLQRVPIAIITGGCLKLVQHQVLNVLSDSSMLNQLHIMPTNGTSYYRINEQGLYSIYEHTINPYDTRRVFQALQKCAQQLGIWKRPGDPMLWGEQIEYRGSQITFSALGQQAPADAKKHWDEHGELQQQLVNLVALALPDFSVRAGGETSVDVMAHGGNKANALSLLAEYCDLELDRIAFIGDRMQPGGNDYPATLTPVYCVCVEHPQDTLELCERVLG